MKLNRITAVKHAGMYQPPTGSPCWHRIEDAAKGLGKSISAIRRAINKQTDVQVLHGQTVAGMIELSSEGRPGYLPYHA